MKTLRVLIVEDEPLLAMDLESIVTDTVSAAVIVKSSVAGAKKFLDSQVLDSQVFLLREARGAPRSRIPSEGRIGLFLNTEPLRTRRIKMAIREDFVRHLEAEMADIEQHLKPLESGGMIIKQGPPGFMADVTAREVRSLKDAHKRIEMDIAQYRGTN